MGKALVPGYQHGRSIRIVFCLGKHIGSDDAGIVIPVSNDQDFTRACNRIGGNNPVNLPLCLGNIRIPRSDNFMDSRNGLGSVSKCGDSMSASDLKNMPDPAHFCCCKDCRMYVAVCRWRGNHDDFTATGNLSGNQIHQHCGWICRRPVRNIHADFLNRPENLSENYPVLLSQCIILPLLRFMVPPDIIRRLFEYFKEGGINLTHSRIPFITAYFKTTQGYMIKLLCKAK